jgi:hypothetical protein
MQKKYMYGCVHLLFHVLDKVFTVGLLLRAVTALLLIMVQDGIIILESLIITGTAVLIISLTVPRTISHNVN